MDVMKGLLLLLTTTITGSVGALYLKKAMDTMPELSLGNVAKSKYVYLGFFFYIVSAVTNIVLLADYEYSVVFPMTSLTYVWTALISVFVFREKLTPMKATAIIVLIIGVFIISR